MAEYSVQIKTKRPGKNRSEEYRISVTPTRTR